MVTKFNDKMFIYKRVGQWIVVLLVYFMLFSNPISTMINMELIPQINTWEFFQISINKIVGFAYLGTGITFLLISIVNVFLNKYTFFNHANFSCEKDMLFKEKKILKKFILDFSNPFLLACKTKGLRE